MKVRLLRDARIKHNAGEVVEVSSAEFNYLVSINSAEPVVEEPAKDNAAKPPCRSGQRKTRERRADHAADTAPGSKDRAPD